MAFEKLLAWLDADRNRAGERYELLREKLIVFFSRRGISAEEYADKVLDRVADLLERGKAIPVGNQELYCLRVAVYLAKEFWYGRENRLRSNDSLANLDDSLAAGQFDDEQQQVWQEQKSQCMKDCLNCLPSDQKRLLVMYYGGDEKTRASNRRRLAKDLRISDQALRVRVHRLRYVLKERYEACLKRRHLK